MITYEKEVIIWECIVFTEETKADIEERFCCNILADNYTKDDKIISYVLTKNYREYYLIIGDTVCYDRVSNRTRIKYQGN